jgi:hypothetical protein
MDNKNLTIVAISALAAALLAGCMFMSSEIAFAYEHHHSKFVLQATTQATVCGNGIMSLDTNCQNIGNQINGDHNSANITDIRPNSSFSGFDLGNDGYNGHTEHDNISPIVNTLSSYIPSGNPITGADP